MEPSWVVRLYRFTLRNWNALLAGSSLAGVAIFSFVPPLERFVQAFIFLAANSVVWTIIELKIQLSRTSVNDEQIYPNMRKARPAIVLDIENRLHNTSRSHPLTLILIGGRMRSMSDIIREIADDLQSGSIHGHLNVDAYCVDPSYLSKTLIPGDVPFAEQSRRNIAIGHLIESIKVEIEGLSKIFNEKSSLTVSLTYYCDDPFCYAYLIGDQILYWGPFTWDKRTSDLLGPENPCLVVSSNNPAFVALRDWIQSRTALYRQQSLINGISRMTSGTS